MPHEHDDDLEVNVPPAPADGLSAIAAALERIATAFERGLGDAWPSAKPRPDLPTHTNCPSARPRRRRTA